MTIYQFKQQRIREMCVNILWNAFAYSYLVDVELGKEDYRSIRKAYLKVREMNNPMEIITLNYEYSYR